MKALILAGGFGTRLRSVVKNVPKSMAPIGEKAFIEYIIDNLKSSGITDCTLCLYYLAEKIVEHLGDGSKFGMRVGYSIEKQPMGTGGAIGILRNELDSTFCVVNGDTFLRLDVNECLNMHKRSGAIATVAVARVNNGERYGKVVLDKDGYINAFIEKEKSEGKNSEGILINAGFYIFEPEIFKYIKENEFVSIENDVFPKLIKHKQKIYGYSNTTDFFDIGVAKDYFAFISDFGGKV